VHYDGSGSTHQDHESGDESLVVVLACTCDPKPDDEFTSDWDLVTCRACSHAKAEPHFKVHLFLNGEVCS
jgi:hypothetical protein